MLRKFRHPFLDWGPIWRNSVLVLLACLLLWTSSIFQKQAQMPAILSIGAETVVAIASKEPTINLDSLILPLNGTSAVQYYDTNVDEFCNKCDFEFYPKFLSLLSCCHSPDSAFIIGGLNEGLLADLVLQHCSAQVHGFEIQQDLYESLLIKYSKYGKQVTINNLGMSNQNGDSPMTVLNSEGAGLFSNFRNSTLWDGHTKSYTTRLDDYIESNNLKDVCMILIDVEGHEPQVLQGLSLQKNAKLAKILVYELGGTWPDSRHTSNWTQYDAAFYLTNLGYRLFLIGSNTAMEVDAMFFQESKTLDEGFGFFVQGNLLAVHTSILL